MLKKDQLPGLTDDIISTVLKSLDKFDLFEHDGLLSTVPVGKLAGYFAKKKIEIGDADKALHNAVAIVYYVTFIEAVNFFNLNSELSETVVTTLKNRTKITTELEIFSFDRAKFDIDNYNNNEVAKFYKSLFKKVLSEYQITEENAIKIEKYINDYVKLNFYQILEKNQTVYAKVHSFLNSESYELIRENYLFDCYKTDLKNLFNEPVWNDTHGLTLNNLYVKPHFKIHQYCFKRGDKQTLNNNSYKDDNGFIKMNYPYNSVHEFLYATLLRKDILNLKTSVPQLILLLGYPGQGKTSFCKKMLHDTYIHGLPLDKDVFFVKFRDISRVKELINNPLLTLKNKISKEIGTEISDREVENSILLLDGLDELYMKENMQKNEIDEFIKSFLLEINTYTELKVIITTRYGYLDLAKLKERNVLICQLQELDIEQQKEWLSNYTAYHSECVLTNDKLQEIHEKDNLKHIAELVKQPLLLHMVAHLPEEINSNDNRAKIYDKMFEALVKREYDSPGGQIENLRGPDEKDLRKLIREIAFEIFRSGNEYIHKNKLEQLEAVEKFIKKLENQQFNNALKGLMIAFYFQEVRKREGDEGDEQEKREDYAIEFLHKSLKEYLVAEKIWITIKQFVNKNSEGDYTVDDFNQAMDVTFPLFAYQALSKEIIDYLDEIIQNDESSDKKKIHGRMAYFFPYYIKNNFLKEYKAEKRPLLSPYDLANNHFYGYWSVLSLLGIDKNVIPEDTDLLDILAVQIKVTLHNIKYLRLSKQILNNVQLEGVNLEGANLERANLERANLEGANLEGANLERANLEGANLERANLERANLERANLERANLEGANFDDANLDDANLEGANLERANLERASINSAGLDGANLNRVSLDGAKLINASLIDVSLIDASLIDASLNGASLNGASLNGASLNRANLDRANIIDARIKRASLSNASLKRANLEGANLEGANLEGANLERANLEGANLERANLIEANLIETSLERAKLSRANLDGANLDGANLKKSNLNRTSLNGASLDGASLDGASLIDANLNGVNFKKTNLDGANLVQADLKYVKNLTIIQLKKTASLKDCKNLDPALRQGVIDAGYEHLFE